MFRKLIGALGFAALLAGSSSLNAQVWSVPATAGAIESASLLNYYASQTSLAFQATATGTVGAIYGVTTPMDSSTNPAWTTMEFTARNPGGSPATFAQAILYRIPKNSASGGGSVCIAQAPATGAVSTTTCFLSSAIDFNNYRYYVRVLLSRDSTASIVAAYEIRIH
ncbi:MAG: hypothetical protein ABUT39_01990 [Acidobacteriota bacterium]